jgi:lysylphosphatidylglycerol synthetase-like protein (DUF2156 family)
VSRLALVQRFGRDPIAWSTLQPDMRYADTAHGFMAYRECAGMQVALGGPVAEPRERSHVARAFLSQAARPVVHYLSREQVGAFDALSIGPMGADRYVDTAALLEAPSKKLASAVAKAAKRGFVMEEVPSGTLPERLQAISRDHLRRARCKTELTFLNAPLKSQTLRRTFALAKHDDEHRGVFGVVALNPYFEGGVVKGYLLDVLRFEKTRLWGVWFGVVWHLARLLQAEGKELSLGFCPLRELVPLGHSPFVDRQATWLARYFGNTSYVRHLYEMKSEVPGRWEPRYFASFSPVALVSLLALVWASDVRVRSLLTNDLWASLARGLHASR